jgi:hypothetical protein
MNKTDEIVNSLEGLEKASPAPFLATRIKAKMAGLQQPGFFDRLVTRVTRPVVAVSVLAIILAINCFAFLQNDNSYSNAKTQTGDELIVSNFESGSIYNFENNLDDEK